MACIAIPIILGYGLAHLLLSDGAEKFLVSLLVAGLLSVIILILRRTKDGKNAYRNTMAILSVFLLYTVVLGSHNGGEILWLYIFPLIYFFLFGVIEGFIWISLMMVPVFIMLLFPDLINSFNPPVEFKIRFIISIMIVIVVACLLESLRLYFYELLKKQKTETERALQNIKTLKGLIPICATCKKIRDDKGYWQAVEQYISEQTGVQFTHGICEDCLKKTEPKLYQNLIDQGEIKPAKTDTD